jgi:hypothetical protein
MKPNQTPKWRRLWWIIGIVLVVLIIIRLLLPFFVLRYVNKSLASMEGYYGHVKDVDLSLYRGAYIIDSVYLNKVDKKQKQTPFISAKLIDLSVEWKALLKGSLVGEAVIQHPKMEFTLNKVEPSQVQKDTSDFRRVLKDLMPLKVNRFEIHDGELRYKDLSASPKVDIGMKELNLIAENLRNSYKRGELLPASVKADAIVYGGSFNLSMKLNPLAEKATFDLNSKLENTDMTALNDFLKAYAGVDVNKGKFGLYTEMAAKKGRYKGYVKPVIKDLDVVGPEDKNDNLFGKLWEHVVGGAAQVLKNKKKDQLATEIPLEGSTNNLDANTWYAIIDMLRNAFIQALTSSVENKISIASVAEPKEEKKGFFKKLFGSDDDDNKKKDKDKKAKGEEEKKTKKD